MNIRSMGSILKKKCVMGVNGGWIFGKIWIDKVFY